MDSVSVEVAGGDAAIYKMEEKPTESELPDEEAVRKDRPDHPERPEISLEKTPQKRRSLWLRGLFLVLKVILLTPFYLVVALAAFGGGGGYPGAFC